MVYAIILSIKVRIGGYYMLIKYLDTDFKFENETGLLVQLVHEGWNQINVLVSTKGSIRGGHFHKVSNEAFYIVSGKCKLILENAGEKEENELKAGDFFLVSPFQKHTFIFDEDTIMVSMYDICVENADGSKDIYKE